MRRFRMFGKYRNPRKPLSADEVAAKLADLEKKAEEGLVAKEVGHCQACEAKQKLELDRTLTFHGYKRPGHGQTVGECPGVGSPPYELSCELIRGKLLPRAIERLTSLRISLAKAHAPDYVSFYEERRQGLVEVNRSDPQWEYKLARHIQGIEREIRYAEENVRYYEQRIARWEPKEIKTVVEDEKKRLAESEANRKARQEKRDARLAKQAATKAKQDDLKARRAAIVEDFRARAKDLASKGEHLTPAVLKLWKEINAKKHSSWLWTDHLEIDDELVKLGLATPPEPGSSYTRVTYKPAWFKG